MAFTDTNGTKEPKMQISLVDAYLKRPTIRLGNQHPIQGRLAKASQALI